MSSYTGTAGPDVYYGGGSDDVISGLGANDTLYGGGGADDITGGDGDDILVGEGGSDILHGGLGADHLYGGDDSGEAFDFGATNLLYGEDGDDTLVGGSGADQLYGGIGADTITAGDGNTAYGEAGDDTLSGYHATLNGGADNDVLRGLGGSLLIGGAGADRFKVGAISYLASNLFYDTITDLNAAAGDRLDFGLASAYYLPLVLRGAISDPNFSLAYGKVFSSADYGPGFLQVWTWSQGGDTFLIADLDGNGALSTLDYVIKVAGQVTLDFTVIKPDAFTVPNGGAGVDLFAGTVDADTFYGLNGDDQLHGGAERDLLYGNNGADKLWGDDDNDTLYGGLGNDQLDGGAGGDRIYGGGGSDTLHGGDDSDSLYASGVFPGDADDANAVNLIYGEGGDDIIYGGLHDQLYGGEGGDLISGGGGLYGEAGNDQLSASGSAVLDGGTGDDVLTGGTGNDELSGGAGKDNMAGGGGADILHIDLGDAAASGQDGDDLLMIEGVRPGEARYLTSVFGDGDNDTFQILGDLGVTVLTLDGGAGSDLLKLSAATGAVQVDLRQVNAQQTGMGNFVLSRIENVIGGDHGSTLVGDDGDNSLFGGAGDDLLIGLGGDDTLDGGGGVDWASYSLAEVGVTVDFTLTGPQDTGVGRDTLIAIEHIEGSAFSDVLVGSDIANGMIGGDGQDWLRGGGGGDTLLGGNGDDSLWGGVGDDGFDGGPGNDTIDGGAGTDTVNYSSATSAVEIDLSIIEDQLTRGAGVDTLISIENLIGSNFDDVLTGSAVDNWLNGGNGVDTLRGGGGADVLFGGAGADLFVFGPDDSRPQAPDLIYDFAAGDRIDLSAIDANTALAGDQAFALTGQTGHAGDLSVAYNAGAGLTYVSLYLDNSGALGAQIALLGDHHTLTAADFIL